MFLNQKGKFEDVSLGSGIDFLEDGRGFAIADFDKDGLVDFGVISNQEPRLRIAQFNVAESDSSDLSQAFVQVRLVGGNETADSNPKLSPHDPVGAILIARTASSTRMFQLSRGEGFSVQNSRNVHIGLGKDSKIEELKIRWPSGRTTVEEDIMAGSRVEFREIEN